MGIKELVKRGILKVWDDLYDVRLDDKAAPNLHDVYLGREASIYADPREFFEHTYMTRSMRELIEEVADALKGGKGGRIFLLTSLFGGGKTHTLITLYHAFKDPGSLLVVDEELATKVAEVGKVQVLVMDASSSKLVPHPDEPYKAEEFTVKTIWGMLAYRLGAYARMKNFDDKNAPAPDVEPIRAVLAEAKVPILILMDEIVHYVFNMYRSRLKDYGEKVVLFLDYLARAVEALPNVVLAVSIQAEYRMTEGRKILLEEEMFKGYAEKILKSLTRETSRIVVPVTPDDVVKVLQRRIFREIPESEAWKAQDKLHRAYKEAPELFGVESDWQTSTSETGRLATARETYPFHPKYIEVLHEFVSRNRDLQKTRDAIRITRKAVRRLLRGNEDPGFIMPWHIDLRDGDIRGRVLTDSYKEFKDIASRDIVSEDGRLGSITECSKPQLALRIATAILLKTYTYETFKEPLKVFPDLKTVALMVYEPETFASEGWQSPDIKTMLEEMESRLPHFVAEGGRYWFTPYPSVIEYVNKKAEEMVRGPKIGLYKALKDYVRSVLVRREGRRIERGEAFKEQNVTIIGYGDLGQIPIKDDESLKLVVFVKPDVNKEDVKKVVLQRPEGGKRTFANTVVAVYPSPDADFNALLRYVANIKSAEEIMDTLSEYYTDRDIRSLQQRKLKRYIDDNVKLLTSLLLGVLTSVAYPRGGDIEEARATPSTSIIAQVEALLKDPRTGEKLRTDIGFKDLGEFLRKLLNWDLVEGDRRFEFREIVEVFYTNTAAPFTTREALEQAILFGVDALDVGVSIGGKLYWKRIGPENGAEKPERIGDTDVILPYRVAARILKDELLAKTGIVAGPEGVKKVWYEVEVAGKSFPLEDLIRNEGWELALKGGIILKKEEFIPRGFILEVKPSLVKVEPGKAVEASISITPVDGYSEDVRIEVSEGSLDMSEGRPPLKTTWRITPPDKPGEYKFTVKATGSDGTVKDEQLLVTVLSPEEDIVVDKVDPRYVGAKLVAIDVKNISYMRLCLNIISNLGAKAKADLDVKFGGEASFKGESMDVSLARVFVEKFNDIISSLEKLRAKTSVEGTVRIEEPLVLDSSKITSLSSLAGKAKFKLRVKRGTSNAG